MKSVNAGTRQAATAVASPQVVVPGQGLVTNHPTPTGLRQRYIGRITAIDGSSGTGTLVSLAVDGTTYNLVVTAAHVIYDEDTRKPVTQATFTPAYCPGSAPGTGVSNPSAPYGTYPIGQPDMFIPDEYADDSKHRYDYGVLLVRRALEAGLGSPPVMADLDPALGQNIAVYGYPAVADGNMAGNTGIVVRNGNGLVIHNVSTGPGSSGAPVMQTGNLAAVVAVHTGGGALLDLNWGPLLSTDVVNRISDWIRDL
jgi:V8-like Glu-specific endopeptidase